MVPGYVGNALRFVFGSYVRVNNSASQNSLLTFDNDADFTIDAWIKGGIGPIVSNFNQSTKLGYSLSTSGGTLRFDMGCGSSLPILSWKRPITPNAWNFVAVVVKRSSSNPKGHNVTLYSGTNVLPAGNSKWIPLDAKADSGLPLDIGKCLGNEYACVAIDELEIFNRALPLADLQRIFNAGHNGKCINPVGIKKN